MMQPLHRYACAMAWPWHRLESLQNGRISTPFEHAQAADGQTRDVIGRVWRGAPLIPGIVAEAQKWHRPNGDHRCLVGDRDRPGQEILQWRALTMRLPPGMLIAAGTCAGRAPLRLQLLHRIIAPTIPVAHLHLHVNAAVSFELVWAHLCARAPTKIKHGPLGMDAEKWRGWLARARLARLLIHAHVTWPSLDWPTLARRISERPRDVLKAMGALLAGTLDGQALPAAAVNMIADRRRKQRLRTVDDVWRNDPLSDGSPWPEGRLLQLGFRAACAVPDAPFARLFAQYLRVRCLLYRHLLDDPDAQGLGLFTATYDQLKPYRAGLDHVFPQVAAVEPPLQLGALEVRTAPPDGPADLRGLADHLRKTVQAHPTLEVGWVFHVIRHIGRSKPLHTLARATRRGLQPLMTALRAEPELLRLIRGLDIAGDEMSGPLWLALPTLMRARDLSEDLAARKHLPPLQVSVHAGEDFRHLASGLRSIDEPIEWNLLRRGDRLGHALALGLDANTWVDAHPIVEVPRWVRLLDLQWMIARISSATAAPLKARTVDLPYLESCLAKIAEELDCLPTDKVWDILGKPAWVERLMRDTPFLKGAEAVVRRRLFARRGPIDPRRVTNTQADRDRIFDQTMKIDTRPERDLLIALRADIATRVRQRQIIVELNPSSNLSVAGFAHPLAQPHYHLLPWNQSDAPVPILTLSADDPLQFATSLSDEYAYAWAGLVLGAGRQPGEVNAWLNEAAANSWRARFTMQSATVPAQ